VRGYADFWALVSIERLIEILLASFSKVECIVVTSIGSEVGAKSGNVAYECSSFSRVVGERRLYWQDDEVT